MAAVETSTGEASSVIFYGDVSRKVRACLLKQARLTGDEEQESECAERECIGRAQTSAQFFRWAERRRLPFKLTLVKGQIFIKEIPTWPHSTAVKNVFLNFWAQDPQEIGIITLQEIDMPSEVNPDDGHTPDLAIFVKGPNRNFPVIVIEIGVSQDVSSLSNKAKSFLGQDYPTVVFYIALKRYDFRQSGDQGMVAFLYHRDTGGDVPVQIISFGTGPLAAPVWASLTRRGWAHLVVGVGVGDDPPCNGFDIPRYVLVLPATQVFRGLINGPPASAPVAYYLDLFKVQGPFRTTTIRYNE